MRLQTILGKCLIIKFITWIQLGLWLLSFTFFKKQVFNDFNFNFNAFKKGHTISNLDFDSCSLKKFKSNAFTSKALTLFTLNPTWTLTIALKIFKNQFPCPPYTVTLVKHDITAPPFYEFLNHVWWLHILV